MIVATGLGAVSAVGRGCDALWAALAAGVDGLRPIRRFSVDGASTMLGGLVPGYEEPRTGPLAHRGLSLAFAREAAREAWVQARLDVQRPAAHRIALVNGTSIGDDLYEATPLAEITEALGDALGIEGPRITVSTACTSSTNAIGLALDLLRAGVVDVAIAGGTDVMTPEIFAGFRAAGVLANDKCAPFSHPFGTTLGEGAGYLVLETRAAAEARGASPIVAVAGYGLSADAHHETAPDPTGSGVARAMNGAIVDAGLTPSDIEYVNAHGTGTEANDRAEWRAIQRVLGERATRTPVSSTKSVIGHAQGAAGVLELIATILAMRADRIPQTLHFAGPRAFGPADPVGEPLPRPGVVERALCSSAAFGGANAAVVVARASAIARAATAPRRAVFVRGVGSAEPPFRFEDIVPSASPRGLNPSSQLLTAAATRALVDAGLRLRNAERDRTGLVVGATRVSPESARELQRSIEERGLAQLSTPAFARMVLNAPAGACSKLLMLRGPTSTVDTGEGSGLVAIAYAAELLAAHDAADLVLAGAFDEIDPVEPTETVTAEGASCVVLGITGDIALAGWGMAGPGRVGDAVEQALAMARLDSDVDARFDVPGGMTERGLMPADASAAAFARAVLSLRGGGIRSALVTSSAGRSTTCAVVLSHRGAM
jgi:3-oxoacyl-[acyl-carrier-protein] synthase II